MKRLILMILIALGVLLLAAGLALANGGPHGGYTPTTAVCAGCHRAHTAIGANLLTAASTYDLCISCHGALGAGANTNVSDGFYLATRDDATGNGNVGAGNTPNNSPLLGGGFDNYKGLSTTSTHSPTGSTAAAWGNGVARGVTANLSGGNLSCGSCHDPHGSSVYRIIYPALNSATVTAALVDEGAAKDYDSEHWGSGMSSICTACHSSYHVTRPGSGSDKGDGTLYGGDTSTFAHRVDMPFTYGTNANPETAGYGGLFLPLAESGTANNVVCQTCHLAHGSSAAMTGFADGTGLPGRTDAADSALLRLDNRGACEVCHQKS